MTGDGDIDIEALLDAPLRAKQQQQQEQQRQKSALDVIDEAKSESKRRSDRSHHERDPEQQRGSSHRHRSRSRDRHRRHRSRSPRGHHDSGRRGGLERSLEAPLTEAQRDRRTVFCRQLAQRVRSDDLRAFCEGGAGKVRDVRLVYDRISNRSKGVAYVEFVEEATVQKALGLTGQKLCGVPVIVELTETEKNRLAEEAAAEAARRNRPASAAAPSGGPVGSVSFSRITRVFVGGLHPSLDEQALRRVFDPFGDIELVEFTRDASSSGAGGSSSATIHFRNAADAGMAVDQMNGFELAGRPIRVGILRDRPDGTNSVQYRAGDVFTANLDDAETQGLTLSAKTRGELMMKLARDPVTIPGQPAGPSPCVLLAGMYDPEAESEVGWEYAIGDEVRDECTRFGPVAHLSVAKTRAGEVWLRFATAEAGRAAVAGLNGRWFGGRQIKAIFVHPSEYQQRFPMQA